MRTPRSNFVVEYKTSRRVAKPRSASIWGNLDLQAVARQIETDEAVPQGISEPYASTSMVTVDRAFPTLISEAHSEDEKSTILAGRENIPRERLDIGELDDQSSEILSADQAKADDLVGPANGLAEKQKGRGSQERRLQQLKSPNAHSRHAAPESLALLEADNRYLKRLMLVKLREENEWMQSVLNRLESV
ncbi:MAG: hypothetical protein IH622_17205 [Ochrobactrum anthropi]|uniref:Uncharacterized protein n=1 Tax=Brucella anthropi TaxID=529 RepID=A0A8I0TBS7_BRUAN|nr:hypothetical protein [Brucella anthropi]